MARIDDYKESFRLASEELKGVNPHRVAKLGGATVDLDAQDRPQITLRFFNNDVAITIGEEIEIQQLEDSREVSLPEKIILCHYLLGSDGSRLTNNLINFRQIPDGHFYFSAFQKRATEPLLMTFGNAPETLLQCGEKIGAVVAQYGDFSITVPALPKIPITLVLWKGDDEFPPEASILFDETIMKYLPVEDVAVISGMTVYKLMGIKKTLES